MLKYYHLGRKYDSMSHSWLFDMHNFNWYKYVRLVAGREDSTFN